MLSTDIARCETMSARVTRPSRMPVRLWTNVGRHLHRVHRRRRTTVRRSSRITWSANYSRRNSACMGAVVRDACTMHGTDSPSIPKRQGPGSGPRCAGSYSNMTTLRGLPPTRVTFEYARDDPRPVRDRRAVRNLPPRSISCGNETLGWRGTIDSRTAVGEVHRRHPEAHRHLASIRATRSARLHFLCAQRL